VYDIFTLRYAEWQNPENHRDHLIHNKFTYNKHRSDLKYLESVRIWCWRRMEKISWTDHVRNEEVLHTAKEKTGILHPIKRKKANWTGHILRRNCLLRYIIDGKTYGTERRKRRKQLLDDLKKNERILKTEIGTIRSHCLADAL
jgi:hypothetical protein